MENNPLMAVAPNSGNTVNGGNMTREIAPKELSFEDISVHSPGLFRQGDAMRALRENPTAGTLRTALKELNATGESFERILENAKDMMGTSQQDLERIKTNIKRLKFGTIELSTEQAFLRSILEARPLPREPPVESEEFKARNAQLKQLKDVNDADEKSVEALVESVGQSAAAFAAEHAALRSKVDALEALEAEAEAAELAGAGVSADAIPDPADEHLTTEEARAALDALDAEVRVLSSQVKSRENEAAAMRAALEPDEAALASVNAELKLLAGAERSNRREAAAMAQIAETEATIREQKALVERLQGVQVLSTTTTTGGESTSSSGATTTTTTTTMTLRMTTRVPSTPAFAMEPIDGSAAGPTTTTNVAAVAPARDVTHTMTVTFYPGSNTAVKSAVLDPPDVPIDDVVATAMAMGGGAAGGAGGGGGGGAEDVLRNLVCETRVRVAATAARREALTAAATQTPMDWYPNNSKVLVRLYGGLGGEGNNAVAQVNVPLEWPLNGARVRMTGLAGLAPAIVASAAQRVDPGGYESLAAALRATQDALAAAGHFPPMISPMI